MARKFKIPVAKRGTSGSPDRVRSRMILALSMSVVLHIVVAISMRPDYKPVADHAVEFSVSKVTPGPPKKAPKPKPKKPAEPKAEKKAPPPKKKPGPGMGGGPKRETKVETGSVDGGTDDGGITGGGEEEGVAAMGGGSGSGICMPNLFPFAGVDSSWVLWVSLSSFRETAIQKAVTSTLARFVMGKTVVDATGLDPNEDVEGVLVGAKDIFKPSSYRVVVGYDSSEGKLKSNLSSNLSDKTTLQWTETLGGWKGEMGNSSWDLAGSGRVLVAGHKASAEEGLQAVESKWPKQVECISSRTMGPGARPPSTALQTNERRLIDLAKSFIAADATGRWPVALLATSDPRTLGLRRGQIGGLSFQNAVLRAFFSDPILIEGEVRFRGPVEKVATIAEDWRKTAATVQKDPFFAIAGLSGLFNQLTVKPVNNKIVFSLKLTEGQARAALLFLQLQGDVLERHLKGK